MGWVVLLRGLLLVDVLALDDWLLGSIVGGHWEEVVGKPDEVGQ